VSLLPKGERLRLSQGHHDTFAAVCPLGERLRLPVPFPLGQGGVCRGFTPSEDKGGGKTIGGHIGAINQGALTPLGNPLGYRTKEADLTGEPRGTNNAFALGGPESP